MSLRWPRRLAPPPFGRAEVEPSGLLAGWAFRLVGLFVRLGCAVGWVFRLAGSSDWFGLSVGWVFRFAGFVGSQGFPVLGWLDLLLGWVGLLRWSSMKMGIFEKDRDLTEAPTEVRLDVDASDFRVPVRGFAMRLDRFLAHHLKWRSRSSVQGLIRGGYVEVDAARPEAPRGTGVRRREGRPGAKLLHGSSVFVRIPDEYRTLLLGETSGELDVLFEDRDVVVVDKPPLVAVHPSGRHMSDTLIQRVHLRYREEIEAGELLPRLCHRLDRETSGIVLLSKRPVTHPGLTRQFEDRLVKKHYLAIVDGIPEKATGSIDAPIRLSTTSPVELEMTTAADGLPCQTDWETLATSDGYALLRLQIHTGRQHQIRVHMAAIGTPLVGDKLYGPDREIFLRAAAGEMTSGDRDLLVIDRHALHSHRLVFDSPAGSPGGASVEVTSGLPDDLCEAFPAFAGA